jgi:2',3'-cyclic-nucleotide 2'-phosphodiesterase (5'-nucleotidase family)
MRDARYAILGANVRYHDGRDVDWIRNDTLVEVGGVRVGIIGIATVETPRVTLAANVSDLQFVDPVPVVLRHARSLRDRGADLVVVIAHAGAFCDAEGDVRCSGEIVELARGAGRAIDAIISGHTHSLVRTVENGVPIVQARSASPVLPPGKPTIAAVNGYCFGGAMELACWCDFRVVAENAEFGALNRQWGVTLIEGGTQR